MRAAKTAPSSGQHRGGVARSEVLSPARRREIASRAAQARWKTNANLFSNAGLEDFQVNTDTIDAADILVTELNDQVVMFSRSGARALEKGQIIQAKSIISAIESTQEFLERAERLKMDIAAFYERLTSQTGAMTVPGERAQERSDQAIRKQDRTDRALLNAKRGQILSQLETEYGVRLNRRSSATYKSDDDEIGIVCTISKWYPDGDGYWYAYHSSQDRFLGMAKRGYLVLGMMDSEHAIVLPREIIFANLEKLSTTTIPGGETYWHLNIDRDANGALSLHRAKGEPSLRLDDYVVRIAPK